MAKRFIDRFRNLLFSTSEWTAKNPVLVNGEIGFEYDDGDVDKLVKRFKVGNKNSDVAWNDLDYFGADIGTFSYNGNISNPIGDAIGNLYGKPPEEVLRLILNPYKIPAILDLKNDAAGAYANTAIREIGNAKSGNITLSYSVDYLTNLLGASPIVVEAGGLFSNEGAKPYGNIVMTLASTLNPGTPVVYEIMVKANHLQGVSPVYSTYLQFAPKIIWGVSGNADENASGINSLNGKQTRLATDITGQYSFLSAGYRWLAIPDMLDKAGIYFVDSTVPQAPIPDDYTLIKTISINNGVGTYNYALYRSTYFINSATKTTITK